jgi:SAM-dependent methyltransferase
MTKVKYFYLRLFRRKALYAFLGTLPADATVMDVGCGNDSSYNIKTVFPRFTYTGVDVGNYNETKPRLADHYVVVAPDKFADAVGSFKEGFDAVISSHNLEHCDEREKTLRNMLDAVKPGGRLYLSFPTEASVDFPHRKRTLNYYDDDTHKDVPPRFDEVLRTIREHGFTVEQALPRYRPAALWLLGLLQEPLARMRNDILQGTWAFFGFESIIWARKTGR